MAETLLVATANQGKLRELRELLQGFSLVSLKDVGIDDLDEPGADYRSNAVAKAREASKRAGMIALADDSGLEVDALGHAPGWFSARFGGTHGRDAANRETLIAAMRGVGEALRGARFRCCVAVADVRGALGDRVLVGLGTCGGRVITEPRGTGGFGYDPLLIPEGFTQTLAELDESVKNAISHRAKAIADVAPALRAYFAHRPRG
ncbi:MAG: RdgB/HAM1 family non-canonical purine NTP pyrophosphatase [Polyangiales bacterium]